MLWAQALLLYCLFGCGVAVALFVTDRGENRAERIFSLVTAFIFWPLYLPIVLANRSAAASDQGKVPAAQDALAAAIRQVDAELSAALASLEGWAGGVLAEESQRINELRLSWTALAERIREMDRLLASPAPEAEVGLDPLQNEATISPAVTERLRRSAELRRQNLERLRQVRRRAYEDLMGTLAWVRELVSMIHLAKFTGAPASRAQELVAQIAAAVQGLSELSWAEESAGCAADNT